MIALLDTAPHVLGYRVCGDVRADDLARVTRALDTKTALLDRINVYAELDGLGRVSTDTIFQDVVYGLQHLGLLRRIDRVAVVTDTDWLKIAAHIEDLLLPFEVRHFPLVERTDALDWIDELPVSG